MTESITLNGISQLAQPCWQLLYDNGQFVDSGDCVPHFDTELEAQNEASRYALPDSFGTPNPSQLDGACFVVAAACGYYLDEEGAMRMHHESAEDAAKAAEDYAWKVLPNGEYQCGEDCEDCAEAVSR